MSHRTAFMLLLLMTGILTGQEENKIRYGAYSLDKPYFGFYQFDLLKFNTPVAYVVQPDPNDPLYSAANKDSLDRYSGVIALNYRRELDRIYYYTNGYYSKWEAEDRPGSNTLGLLSNFGSNTGEEWATFTTDTSQTGDFLYGPFYRQDKHYRMTYLDDPIYYITHFSIKLGSAIDTGLSNPVVCRLKVRYTYIQNNDTITTLLGQKDVYKNDLSPTLFSGDSSVTTIGYDYSSIMMGDEPTDIYLDPEKANSTISDLDPGFGIEFVVEWTKKYNIIVDNITVYDEEIWSNYLDNPSSVSTNIDNYASSSPFSAMNNLLYWGGIDEPLTLDSYEPIKIVDNILGSNNHKRLIVNLYGTWNNSVNGLNVIENFAAKTEQTRLYLDYYPFWYQDSPSPHHSNNPNLLELLYKTLRSAHNAKKNFYYLAQGMGFKRDAATPYYRKPVGTELRATLLIALGQGAKGLFFWNYFSYMGGSGGTSYLRCDGLVDVNDQPTALWQYIHDSISSRITGKLGSTLAQLEHNGMSLFVKEGSQEGIGWNELHNLGYISLLQSQLNPCFHAGLLKSPTDSLYKKYFMVTNGTTNPASDNRLFKIYIDSTHQLPAEYRSWSLRNIEGGYDTTFNTAAGAFLLQDTIKAGDGKLFYLAPTAVIGGNLRSTDTVNTNSTLSDTSLYIKQGGVLYVNATYTCTRDIIVEPGGKLVVLPGKSLSFTNGAGLKVKGTFICKGTAQNRITITNTSSAPGIYLDSISVDSISYTDITSGVYGIYAKYCEPYISDCSFTDCQTGIFLNHSTYYPDTEEGTKIYNSSFSSGEVGIELYEASALLMGNTVSSQYTGVLCTSNSSPVFTKYQDYGLNQLFGVEAGIISSDSYPLLGYDEINYYGYNSVTGAEINYDIILYTGGYIFAQGCWWGEYPADKDRFIIDHTELVYEPELETDPFGDAFSPVSRSFSAAGKKIVEFPDNPTLSPNAGYKLALQAWLEGNMNDARRYCRQILLNYPDSAVALSALNLLTGTVRSMAELDSVRNFLASFSGTSLRKNVILLAKLRALELNRRISPSGIDGLLDWYPESTLQPVLLFKKFCYYKHETENPDSARLMAYYLLNRYPENYLAKEAVRQISNGMFNKTVPVQQGITPTKISLDSYPNPFNPVTTITYNVGIAGVVQLTVYNAIGEVVQTLVNKEQEPGNYSVLFNGMHFSSGMYICRLQTPSGNLVKKLLLIK